MHVAGPRSKHAKPPTAEQQKAGEGEKKCSWQFYNVSALALWDGKPLSSHVGFQNDLAWVGECYTWVSKLQEIPPGIPSSHLEAVLRCLGQGE